MVIGIGSGSTVVHVAKSIGMVCYFLNILLPPGVEYQNDNLIFKLNLTRSKNIDQDLHTT